jgi:hypothetical protein
VGLKGADRSTGPDDVSTAGKESRLAGSTD